MVGAALSRRALLASAGGAAVAFGTGCDSSSKHHVATQPEPPASPEVKALNHMLDLERTSVAAYSAVIPLLGGDARVAAQRFLGHELAHVSAVFKLVKDAGGEPRLPQATYDLGHPHGYTALLELLDATENAVIAGYLAAFPLLSTGSARAKVASIIANDAQHVSVIRLALARDPVPHALITNTE